MGGCEEKGQRKEAIGWQQPFREGLKLEAEN
jgi:hypothetical protein